MAAVLDNNHEQPGWRAELSLGFERSDTRTVLARRRHVGPLVVQRPFYPEGDVCHIYLVHPPGGIVGGDGVRFDATLEARSHAVITTPAATKFYRSLPDRHASLEQTLRVRDATLEWLPQETILFRDARARTTTRVELTRQSRFIGWEVVCYGRPASGERFDLGYSRQCFEVWIDGKPVLLDRLQIDGDGLTMHSSWGLGGQPQLGTLLAYPATDAELESAREHDAFACTLVDGILSCRLVCSDADFARQAFVKLWQALRPRIVGREASIPRIWAT
jgi:urease accessory protein